jgi:hypothetical protein
MNSTDRSVHRASILRAAIIVSLAALASSTPAFALDGFSVAYPAGIACEFPLGIDGSGGHLKVMEFLDKSGNTVRTLAAGTGSALRFTNLDTGATTSTRSNGFVQRIFPNADGSTTLENMGHTIVIMWPTDVPAGPSTTLYVGRVVIKVEDGSTFTLLGSRGVATDICAALSN